MRLFYDNEEASRLKAAREEAARVAREFESHADYRSKAEAASNKPTWSLADRLRNLGNINVLNPQKMFKLEQLESAGAEAATVEDEGDSLLAGAETAGSRAARIMREAREQASNFHQPGNANGGQQLSGLGEGFARALTSLSMKDFSLADKVSDLKSEFTAGVQTMGKDMFTLDKLADESTTSTGRKGASGHNNSGEPVITTASNMLSSSEVLFGIR
jgi:hypothetical protein